VNMAALAAVFLVLGGGLLVASAVTQTVGRRRMISSRLAGLRVEMRPTLLIHDAESLDRPQDRDRLRQFLTWGMKQTWGVPVGEIQRGIKHGVRKINVDTDNRIAMTAAIERKEERRRLLDFESAHTSMGVRPSESVRPRM